MKMQETISNLMTEVDIAADKNQKLTEEVKNQIQRKLN
jgi:hypothetical protein